MNGSGQALIARYDKPIHFVYAEAYSKTGSTVMRGQQLQEIAKASMPTADIFYSSLEAGFKKSVLFLTKGAIQSLSAAELRGLRKNGNQLVFDPVDSVLPPEKAAYADIIIAASVVALDIYADSFPSIKAMLVDHHIDPRLKRIRVSSKPTTFRAGYFGELVNAIITPRIEEIVDFNSVSTRLQSDDWIKQLAQYPFHYAVRSNQKTEGYKPFLKGFTAAYVGANIIVQSAQDDAVRWLGKDYPYLLSGLVNEKNIIDMLEHARNSYGSKEWQRGLAVMEKMKERTSDKAIGNQLKDVFTVLV